MIVELLKSNFILIFSEYFRAQNFAMIFDRYGVLILIENFLYAFLEYIMFASATFQSLFLLFISQFLFSVSHITTWPLINFKYFTQSRQHLVIVIYESFR